jgi:putative transposase
MPSIYHLLFVFLLGCTLMRIPIRQIKYLNNSVEQDHRGIKRITDSMRGFKAFPSAEKTLVGIELWRRLKKKPPLDAKNTSVFEQFYALAV